MRSEHGNKRSAQPSWEGARPLRTVRERPVVDITRTTVAVFRIEVYIVFLTYTSCSQEKIGH